MFFRIFSVSLTFLFISISTIYADGKLLRGEKWKKFNNDGATADFYVAMNGNDNWSGKFAEPNANKSDGPFASIQRAQEAVQALKNEVYKPKSEPIEKRWIGSPHVFGKGKDILVYIRGGYYSLEETITFATDDGGERVETNLPTGAFEYHKLKDYYVTYAAYPGEKPVISGGQRINNWKKNKKYWVTKVKGIEVGKLLLNEEMQPLARIPNEGYFKPSELPKSRESFKFHPGELKEWDNIEDNRIVMLLRWHTGVNSIKKIDEESQMVYLSEPENGIVVVPPRYYIENIKSLLDAPGEWFFDKDSDELCFIPPVDITDPNRAQIIVPRLSQLMQITGSRDKPIRNLRFYGLNFEGTNSGDNAISFEYAHNCELIGGKLTAMGGTAVYLKEGSYQNRIMENRIINIEGSAVTIAGKDHPDHWMDIVRENIISNNYIDRCGGSSIGAQNCLNTTISYNEVTNNHGRTAIRVGGWRNLEEAIDGGYRVEYNHVHHVQGRADDSGAITSAGLTYDSVIRGNLIHNVKAGYFNNNVAIWFDNMSLGWIAEDNIMYNLEQDEMKLCAANLVDNLYRNNYLIEAPVNPPEGIIAGKPEFEYSRVTALNTFNSSMDNFNTGDYLRVSANVKNLGATGIDRIDFYVDGKVVQSRKFPIIKNNSREISFKTRFSDPGEHRIAIGSTPYKAIIIKGTRPLALYDSLTVSSNILPEGEELTVSARIKNIQNQKGTIEADLLVNEKRIASKSMTIQPGEFQKVYFKLSLDPGHHQIKIGRTPPVNVEVYPHQAIDITNVKLKEFCSATADPCEFDIDQSKNQYSMKIAGTDFFHGEDSYGSIFLDKPVKGNFVATVKIKRFGRRTHQWFRAGLFVRNDITKSFDTGQASQGSVLLFVTPGRVGMNWDEFGDGCMHKASSENHKTMEPYPMWLKFVRHGNSFSGYVSYDGQNWSVSRHTGDIPGIAGAIHLGLAAGGCDERSYTVEFEDFQLEVEKEDWKD